MYYGSALLLFTRELHCVQTLWHVTAHRVIGPYLCAKFQTYASYGFWDTGIQTEEQERRQRQKELEKWTFGHISHVSGPILTKFRCTYILTSAIILWCQKWIITESESANWNFRMYRHDGPRPRRSIIQSTTVLCNDGEDLGHPYHKAQWSSFSSSFRFNTHNSKRKPYINMMCLKATHFIFKGGIYQQVFGTVTGSPVSMTVANLVMEDVEERALGTFPYPPRFWRRYVDYVCVAMRRDQIGAFLDHLNEIEQSIQFTVEVENDTLHYLDTCLHHMQDGTICTSVYRKPSHTDRYLDYTSHTQSTTRRELSGLLSLEPNGCLHLQERNQSKCSLFTKH